MLEIQEQILRLVYDIPKCTYNDLLNCLHPSDSGRFKKYLFDLRAENYIQFLGKNIEHHSVIRIDIKGEKFIEKRRKESEAAEIQKQLNLKEIEDAKKESAEAKKTARTANLIAAISAAATALNFLLDFFQMLS